MKRYRMKDDVRRLLGMFDRGSTPTKGDLVLTGEIHRVIGRSPGNPGERGHFISVTTVWPADCEVCKPAGRECVHPHVMKVHGGGQHGILIPREDRIPGSVVYVMKGFDGRHWRAFTPSPGVFLTESEAQAFCEKNTKDAVVFSYDAVAVGRMDTDDG